MKFQNVLKYFFPPILDKKVINAIHEDDLEKYLEKLGLLTKINKGEINCYFCKEKIEIKNLDCVFAYENDIKFCCDKISCYVKLSEITNKDQA